MHIISYAYISAVRMYYARLTTGCAIAAAVRACALFARRWSAENPPNVDNRNIHHTAVSPADTIRPRFLRLQKKKKTKINK